MKKQSYVSGILDPYGGLRTVVDLDRTFKHHVRCDEMLFVVPNFRVTEPVRWEKIPFVIKTVEKYIHYWIKTRNDPDTLELLPIKMYLIRCRPTTNKRSTDLDAVVMG